MAQQFGYGYGYGYGSPFAATPPRPVASQVPAAPSVGYTPFVSPTASAAPRTPSLSQSTSVPAVTSYYQTAVTSSQQNSTSNYYGYQASAPTPYGAVPFYPLQQQSQPAASYTPPTYKPTPPTYTPSPVSQASTPKSQPSLVSYPTTPSVQKPNSGSYNSYQSKMSTPPAAASQNYNNTNRSSYVNPFQSTGSSYQQNQTTTPKPQGGGGGGAKTPYKPPWLSGANSTTTDSKPHRPTWWNKKPSTGNNQVFYCEVCKISTAGLQPQQAHLEGKAHKKKLNALKREQEGGKKASTTPYHCELCDVSCSSSDALAAHNGGTKHQKVLSLHRRLGKPIPALKLVEDSTGKKVLAGSEQKTFVGGRTLQSTSKGAEEKVQAKVYPPPTTTPKANAKQATPITTPITTPKTPGVTPKTTPGVTPKTTPGVTPQATPTANDNKEQQEEEKEQKPVGEELVKAVINDPKFPHALFKCEMCDCYFNDVNAKWAHIKGRRHRLNYKKIYDKDVYVEPTSAQKKDMEKRKQRAEERAAARGQGGWRGRGGGRGGWGRGGAGSKEGDTKPDEPDSDPWDGGWDATMTPDLKHDPHDDILVMDRHKLIYPLLEERRAVNGVVEDIEKSLKGVSDDLMKEKAAAANGSAENESFRELKGVMRVGAYAHELLLKGECSADLVLLCEKKPTVTLFNVILRRLVSRFEAMVTEKEDSNVYNTTPVSDQAMITVISQVGDFRVTVNVVFSSTLMRPEPTALQLQADQTEGVLGRQYCVAALAALRHTKWFKATSRDIPGCTVVIMRVMKDMCHRVPAWGVLEPWVLELLVQKCALSAHPTYSQPGDLFRRVIECVASGIFLPGGHGLLDPCEKDPVDAAAYLTGSERSSITLSAQHALRLMSFRKLHLVLGVDPLPQKPAKEEKMEESSPIEAPAEELELEGGAVKRPRLE